MPDRTLILFFFFSTSVARGMWSWSSFCIFFALSEPLLVNSTSSVEMVVVSPHVSFKFRISWTLCISSSSYSGSFWPFGFVCTVDCIAFRTCIALDQVCLTSAFQCLFPSLFILISPTAFVKAFMGCHHFSKINCHFHGQKTPAFHARDWRTAARGLAGRSVNLVLVAFAESTC